MNKKFKIKNTKLSLNIILIICIVVSTCILAVGYAEINSTNLNIAVDLNATTYAGIFISNVKYLSNIDADITNSEIVDYTGTMLHSNLYLSTTNTSSSITYEVTIFNNSDANKKFTGITYSDGFYSNQYIGYKLNGLNQNDIIIKGESKTFELTFYYNSTNISNNNLDSYLNFNFDYYFDEENDVDIVINSGDSYTFGGVSTENPISLQNIANIHFMVLNGGPTVINGVKVDVTYTTTTGSKQSAAITLNDENDAEIATQTLQFQGKQTNTVATVQFNNLNISTGEKLSIKFDQSSITNGQVSVSSVIITPIF